MHLGDGDGAEIVVHVFRPDRRFPVIQSATYGQPGADAFLYPQCVYRLVGPAKIEIAHATRCVQLHAVAYVAEADLSHVELDQQVLARLERNPGGEVRGFVEGHAVLASQGIEGQLLHLLLAQIGCAHADSGCGLIRQPQIEAVAVCLVLRQLVGRVVQGEAEVVDIESGAERELRVHLVGNGGCDTHQLLGRNDGLVAGDGQGIRYIDPHARDPAHAQAEHHVIVDPACIGAARNQIQIGITVDTIDAAWRIHEAQAGIEADGVELELSQAGRVVEHGGGILRRGDDGARHAPLGGRGAQHLIAIGGKNGRRKRHGGGGEQGRGRKAVVIHAETPRVLHRRWCDPDGGSIRLFLFC